ncbi:phage tail tape measure protein [Lactococcus lactis]|jgi:TP901 family phage tail tape measure protein|uniref:Phage tail tape measure protein n=1 Tax=Lactococcus lactis TaxID=1358 RepID=A0AAQ0R1N5_9LACT|nr:phage tail tape measure protein [Lactococcus lactis]MCO0831176.1 phage tail tape measure protein [Lactococcus lactis]PAK87822.1 phage tail tape measure protein [Lactococcus lactis]PAL02168.1 phage tail tape measure protein [Lactococcus lactis]RQE28346.1 phage tail tape measure protein [Lactococcus lactis]RQE34913.1 phage tail tape measure protein [Lactococcus lactis]
MADIMVDSVTTGIDLNETKAVEAINRLKSAVKDSTREWQINEAQAKSAGDAVSASKYRYEGLSEAMEKQKAYIANLSEGMKTINRDTDAGEKAYQKYNAQLTTAERSLASMTGQLNRAKSAYEYQQTGIEDLNKSLSANDKLMQSQIDLYEKTRNKMGAAKAEVSGLSTSYAKQTEIYRAQVTELKRLESAEGTSSETLVKQKTRVNEAASSLLNYRNKLLEANLAVTKMQPFNSESLIGKGLNTVYQTTEKATDVMAAGYQKVKSAAYQSAFGIAAIGAAAVKGAQMASELQNQYKTTFNLLVTGGEQAKEAQENVNKMQEQGSELSVKYGKTQKEIADGYQELIKRGYTSSQALAALPTMLQASVASGDDFTDVVHNSTAALESFGMRSNDVAGMTKNTKEAVNQMAYAADMTATDFQNMGVAMEYVGASAHQSKLSLSETASAIGILSNNGLEADKAGTGLRKVIVSLQSPSDAAAAALTNIGLSTKDFVDQNGNMKSMTEIFGLLNQHTEKLSSFQKGQIFHALFGTTGQQAGAILSENVKQLGELDDKVKKSADGQGYVVNLANKNMQSTQNELKQFKAAGEAVLIMIGQKFLPVLSDAATSMAKAFNSKEGKQGLEEIASWIAKIFQGIVDTVKFIGTHKDEVVTFGKIFAGIWATKKIGDVIVWLEKLKKSLLEIQAIDALSGGLGTGGIKSSVGKGVVSEAGTVASTVTKSGVAAEGEALVASGGLSKATSLIPRLLGIIGSVGGSTVLSGGINAGAELLSKDSTAQKTGGVAGSLGGAAVGAAIGSLIAPGIGTAIGAAIGGMGGKNLGKKLGDLINDGLKESSLKSEKLPVVKFDPKAPTKDMKEFSKDYQGFLDKIKKSATIDIVDEKSLEKAKKATADAYAKMSKDIDKFYQNQEKDSKKQVDILVKNGVITQAQADKLNKGQKDLDNKQKAAQKKNLDEMKKNTDNYYASVSKEQKRANDANTRLTKDHDAEIKKIKSGSTDALLALEKKYGKNSPQYQKEMMAEILRATNSFDDKQEKNKKEHSNNMNKIEKDYAKSQTKAEEQMNNQINTATKIAQNKQLDLLDDLKNKKGKLNQKQLIDTLEKADDEYKGVKDKAQKQKDEAVKAANEKYKKTVAAADKERAENGSMSKAQYDEIVKNAQKQRDDTISAAKKQQTEVTDKAQKTHDKTVELANSKADKNVKAAAKEQGETVEQYTKGFKDSRNLINSFIDGINGVLNFLHKGWGNIGHVSLKGFATGTRGLAQDETALVGEEGFELAHHPNRGIFAVGQQGPEIRNLKAGTSILPHSMSKEFLSLTANLPAHADGVSGFLSDALGWVKSTYKDVTSVISKGPKGVVEAIYNGLGLDDLENDFPPVVTRMAKGSAQTAQDNFVKFLQSFFKKAESDAGGSQGSPSGSGVQRWAGQVKQALAANGLSTSQDMIDRVLRQISSESSGNEKAVQGNIGDINNITGDLAKGLMQTISSTFNANKFPGHGDIFNGYDNLLAALNYAKKTYGPSLSFLGNGHGYENGGIINAHGFYEIAEGNRPEMVIPLDPQKKSRANQLLNQAKQTINSNSSHQSNSLGDGGQLVVLVSSILTLLKNGQADPIIQLMLDKNSFAQELAEPMNKQLSVLNSRNKIINAGRTT